jgi:hypothetical protein
LDLVQKSPSTQELLAELYGAMQTFRGLGFPSDNLFVGFHIVPREGPYTGRKCMGVVLRWQDKEFAHSIAPVKNPKRFGASWVKFATAANEGPGDNPELQLMVATSYCRQNVSSLIVALLDKGIQPPLGKN